MSKFYEVKRGTIPNTYIAQISDQEILITLHSSQINADDSLVLKVHDNTYNVVSSKKGQFTLDYIKKEKSQIIKHRKYGVLVVDTFKRRPKILFYAVKRGHTPGIYTSVEEYNKNINGFKGNCGKGFATEIEAINFMENDDQTQREIIVDKEGIYAVKVGVKPGIYYSSLEFLNQTKGYRGFLGKRFNTIIEAQQYMDEPIVDTTLYKKVKDVVELPKKSTNKGVNQKINKFISAMNYGEVAAFVDGAFCDTINHYGAGALMLDQNFKEVEILEKGNHANFIDTTNISGELLAAHCAIRYAISKNSTKITIFYDFEGVEYWATGVWPPAIPVAHNYVKDMKEFYKRIDIDFVKLKAHSNVTYHNRADLLARKALGLQKKEKRRYFIK